MKMVFEQSTGAGERALCLVGATRRGLTLVEVLLSVFILGIGMIMVITVFPIGGDWTRQATESTISQAVAQNALAVIQSHFPQNQTIKIQSKKLVPFPGLGVTTPPPGLTGFIPPSELCYQFGSEKPFPADPNKANYFWTALVRMHNDDGVAAGSTRKYDVYILVYKKGAVDHTYSDTNFPANFAEVIGTRPPSGTYAPATIKGSYNAGVYNSGTGKVTDSTGSPLVPAVGEYGIGEESGTVFKQGILTASGTPSGASPRPLLMGQVNPTNAVGEDIICGGPLMSGNAIVGPSPLVYVYQTTLSWKAP